MTDTPHSQDDKFLDLARELECEEDDAAFDDRVRQLAMEPDAKDG